MFKGPQFYLEEEHSIFKGRTKETNDLLYLVEHSDFSVCYAVSGEGKSSLINAGLCPKLREDAFLPIHIKNITEAEVGHFDEFVWKKIKDAINRERKKEKYSELSMLKMEPKLEDKALYDSIWWKLRTREFRINSYETVMPVLIFDQFEEVFSSAKDLSWTDALFSWLESLYQDENPIAFDHSRNLQKKFKILFSLRSEYVCELDYWAMSKYFIPSLKNNRYYLKPLAKGAALEVASLLDRLPATLSYDDVIRHAKTERSGEWVTIKEDLPCVSALILSLILTGLSERDAEVESKIEGISASSSEDKGKDLFEFLLDNVYKKTLMKCDAVNNEIVKNYVEILEDTLVDVNGRRRHVSERELPPIVDDKIRDALAILEKERIINSIDHHYEISHDSLCSVVNKRKEQRHVIEAKKREEESLRENKKKLMKYFILSGVVLFIMFLVLFFLYILSNNWKLKASQSRYFTAQADNLIHEGDAYMAQLLLLEALPDNLENPNRPYVSEAEVSLRNAHNVSCYKLSNFYGMVPEMSPDGKTVLVGDEDGKVCAVDVNTGGRLAVIEKQDIYSATFSPNQKLISTVMGGGGYWRSDAPKEYSDILLWNTENGSLKKTLKGHSEQVIKTIFSEDGKFLVSSSWDGSIRFWDVTSGNCFMKLDDGGYYYLEMPSGKKIEKKNRSNFISLSSDGKKLLTNFTTHNIEIWDVPKGYCVDTLKGHTDAVYAFHFSPDGNEIVSAGADNTVRIWDVSTGNCKNVLSNHTGTVWDVSYNRNGTKIVTASSDSTVRIWDLHQGICEKSLKLNTDAMKAAFSPDEHKVIISSNDRAVRVWEPYKIPTKTLYNGTVRLASFSPRGEFIAYKGVDDNAKILNVNDQREYKLDKSTYVESFLYNNDGSKLVTTSYDSRGHIVSVWNTMDNRLLCTFKPAKKWSRMKGINICDDDTTIITIQDSTISFWNANTGDCIKVVSRYLRNKWSSNMVLSPNGQELAMVTNEDSICLTNLLTETPMFNLGRHIGASCLSYSKDNTLLASGSENGTVKLFRVSNDRKPLLLDGGSSQVASLFFSNNMKYLASVHKDGRVNIWNNETGYKVGTFNENGDVILSIHFFIDKGTIEGVSENGVVYTWSFPPLQQLIDETRERLKNRLLTHEERRKYYLE